ncbi:hypothetical protein CHCC15136_0648 [Bacillus paralicheniformis]|nr:hypothetical protein SC10_B2orf03005 [Bacillus paralicheniformis]TWM07615.1 hypothetical protein CHCC15136_0648 [Bacillus paralicheniformis]
MKNSYWRKQHILMVPLKTVPALFSLINERGINKEDLDTER